MIYHDDELDPQLKELLGELSETPPRHPARAERARARYLAQVRELTESSNPVEAVSPSLWGRLKRWMYPQDKPGYKKERSPMFSAITAIVVTLTLLFGGAGATVYAAQDAMPNGPLYQIKTASENFRLMLAERTSKMEGEASGLSLYLEFANRRVQEMIAIANQGESDQVQAQVQARLGDQWEDMVNESLAIAAAQEDPAEVEKLLTQIRIHLRDQDQMMNGAPDDALQEMAKVRSQLRQQLQLVEDGIENPMQYRLMFHNRLNRPVDDEEVAPEEPAAAQEVEPEVGEPQQTEAPGMQYGPGEDTGAGPNYQPDTDGEEAPGPGPYNGPGPGGEESPGPGGEESPGSGPEYQNQNQYQDDGQAPAANQEPAQNGETNQKESGK
jgi:hypothetical protein